MHLKSNQSEIKQFEIPSNIQFWMNTCVDLDNQAAIYEISLTVFVCTGLFVAFVFSYPTISVNDELTINRTLRIRADK